MASGRRTGSKTDNNFGPRFGFAYSPFTDGKTVLRGGYGMFTISQQGFGQSGGLPRQPIFADADAGRFNSVDQINPRTTLDRIPYSPADKTGSNAVSISIYPSKNPNAYYQQWNFNVEQQVGTYLFEVGYAGSRGVHLPYGNYNLNAIPVDLAAEARGRFIAPYIRYPQFPNGVTVNTSIGSSSYNSLQVKVERRFANSLGFLAAYTFQKTMATGDLGYRDPLGNRDLDRGIEPNSAPHRFTIAYTYSLPFGRGHRWLTSGPLTYVLGGWEVNGITTLQSGFPLTVTTAQDQCQCRAINRPNVPAIHAWAVRSNRWIVGSTPVSSAFRRSSPSGMRAAVSFRPGIDELRREHRKTIRHSDARRRIKPGVSGRILQPDEHAVFREPQHDSGSGDIRTCNGCVGFAASDSTGSQT